jgi:hypothetical protein
MAFEKCLGRLTQAAGRELSDEEVAAIFERVHKAALDVRAGRVDPTDVGLGKKLEKKLGVEQNEGQTIIQEAAQRAMQEIEHEAALKERRANLQLTKIAARMQDWEGNKGVGLAPLDAGREDHRARLLRPHERRERRAARRGGPLRSPAPHRRHVERAR